MDAIEKKIYTAFASRQVYCGHGNTEDELEVQLWEYAEGMLDEEEEEAFWEQTRHCPYCLEKLLTIQKALNTVHQQQLPSTDELSDMVQQKVAARQDVRKSPALSLHVRLFRQALTILNAVYQDALDQVQQTLTPHYPAPVPVLGNEEHADREKDAGRLVRLHHRINEYDIELELEWVSENTCDVIVHITEPERADRGEVISIALYGAEDLIASRVARDGCVTFQALKLGTYAMRIESAEGTLVEVAMTIESENSP